jgi:heme oxygenase
MTARGQAPSDDTHGAGDDGDRVADDGDVLRRLRTGTAAAHDAVERALDLLHPGLTAARLVDVLTRMHGFWLAAESGLDAWAGAAPADAARLAWSRRRRVHLFAADLTALGAAPAMPPAQPELPAVPGTDDALGRLYVLEGSTLGGVLIDRHLGSLPQLAAVAPLRAFSPYGPGTGAMWRGYRAATRARIAAGGDADRVVAAAQQTFAALAAWCGASVPADGTSPSAPPRRGASRRDEVAV